MVGIVGLLISLMFWSSWGGPGYFSRRRAVYDGGPGTPASGRRTVVEEESNY